MDRFPKRGGTSGRPQGCRPSAAFAVPHLTGLAPNVTFGSGVGTGRPGSGAGNRVARRPNQRSHPSLGPMDLPGPSACVGRGPRSYCCGGGPVRRMGGERHRSVRAQSRRLGGPGWLSAAPGSCSESHGNSGLGQQGGAARGSEGFQACRKRPQAVSCTGLRGASREIASSFDGFRCFGAESSSEQLQYSRENEGATPMGRRGKSTRRMARRKPGGGWKWAFPK